MGLNPPRPNDEVGVSSPSWMATVTPVVAEHELIRRIGGGSYGDVWIARTAVGTWRAVKVVFRDRFLDERPYEREFNGIRKFEPLSRSNEGFMDILQVGRNDAEGYFYYVMELADDAAAETSDAGIRPDTYVPKTLAKALLQRGRLPVGECLELGLTLNLGLAHLHKAGLIHRDIKPSNIIFVDGVPKLADIGLVIEMAEACSFVGTEGFIPPEGPNSPQADLYSLGKVLYEAAMGKDRKDFPEPLTQLSEAPDSAALLEFNAILLKACAANREDRYQSSEEMNADLALLQSGGSVRRQRRLTARVRLLQRAGAMATVLAALVGLGWWWQAKQTKVVGDLATAALAERNRARQSEENTQRLLDFVLQGIVAAARPAEEDMAGMGREVSLLQTLNAAEPRIREAFATQPLAELKLRISLAATFSQLGRATNEILHRERALALSKTLFGPDSRESFSNRMDLAWAYHDLAMTNEYLPMFEEAWRTASRTWGQTNEYALMALTDWAVGYRDSYRQAESTRLLEEGERLAHASLAETNLVYLSLLNALAFNYMLDKKPELAIPMMEGTLAGRERVLGGEHEETTRAMIDLGRCYLEAGREAEAMAKYRDGYEIRLRAQGPQHRVTLQAIDALGRAYERTGHTNEALVWYSMALKLREAKLGPDQALGPLQASTAKSRSDVQRVRAALSGTTNLPPK